jgi:hypothetical protein
MLFPGVWLHADVQILSTQKDYPSGLDTCQGTSARILNTLLTELRWCSGTFFFVAKFPESSYFRLVYLLYARQPTNDFCECFFHRNFWLKPIISKANQQSGFLYVFGDLQDTPGNSKIFHYGLCHIAKHPLGIVKTCEEFGLTCSIYQHIAEMERPIVSCHGSKGGRFIDGMYTSSFGLANIFGISIMQDSGIILIMT